MLFNSVSFAVFLPVVFILYWYALGKSLKAQNILLLAASYVFYGWWDWRFLFLLFFISTANYLIGLRIDANDARAKKRTWLILGLILNIGILGIFKYYDFFINGFSDLVALVGYHLPRSSTRIILPLGISFYTFLSLSYILDIYKRVLKANRDIVDVLLSLSFFPIILAGPIQRPSTLLPQITGRRTFRYDRAAEGSRQILWGLFVKVVVADNLAVYVDDVFSNYAQFTGSTLAIGAVFYAIQIYADFSAYSNMAIGSARLFGFDLMRNFAYPYFSRDIAEFWRRWHISLTTWFRDYVFLPLSFALSRRVPGERVLFLKSDLVIYAAASSVTWFLTGLWHGARLTFIVWGMIHGAALILYHGLKKPRKYILRKIGITNKNPVVAVAETFVTSAVVLIAWVFFRAGNIREAVLYLDGLLSRSILSVPHTTPLVLEYMALSTLFLFMEWLGRHREFALASLAPAWPRMVRWGVYSVLIFVIGMFMRTTETPFIYSLF